MVVVDQGDRGKGRHAVVQRGAADLGARQVPQQLGAVAAAFLRQGIELLDQARLHRYAEPHQVVFHDAVTLTLRRVAQEKLKYSAISLISQWADERAPRVPDLSIGNAKSRVVLLSAGTSALLRRYTQASDGFRQARAIRYECSKGAEARRA